MIVARELLHRYPALRQSWPARQARAWRERRYYRLHPRRMASWFRDMPDLRTRLCISNLEMPEAPHLCRATAVELTLLDPDGQPITVRRLDLARSGSLILELSEFLPPRLRGRVASGQVLLNFEGPVLGSSRAYLHWYNDRCLTSTHEKFGLTIPAVGGYWTVPNVQDDERYRVHLAVVNLDERPYTSTVILKDADGLALEARVELPAGGSRFLKLSELFLDPGGFLGSRPGILYFGNNHQPAMYYYFVANEQLGTWRAQHL